MLNLSNILGILLIRGTEAAVRRCSSKQVFLKISQYSQENTCVGVSFEYNCRPPALQLYEKVTLAQVLPVKIAKFLGGIPENRDPEP